jgi:hypothetical protein
MKYFINFKFLEGNVPLKIMGINIPKWLIKPNNTIQPISISIVAEDGREYYAISKDFNLKEAWNRFDIKRTKTGNNPYKDYWLRENVLKPIMVELQVRYNKETGQTKNGWQFKDFKYLINKYGKTNKQIAKEVKEFCTHHCSITSTSNVKNWGKNLPPEFYAYYADYDWVCFCWLFGKVVDLPTGFPMYCKDLKQMLDEKVSNMEFKRQYGGNIDNFKMVKGSSNLPMFLNLVKGEGLKNETYPKQTNEHNALNDAKWNLELYKFLQKL